MGQGPTCLPAVTPRMRRGGPDAEQRGASARRVGPSLPRAGAEAAPWGGPSLPQMGAAAPGPRTGAAAAPWLGASRRREQRRPRLGVPARRLWTTARGAQGEGGAARHGEPTGKAAEPKRRAGRTAAVEELGLGLGEARRAADGREGRRGAAR